MSQNDWSWFGFEFAPVASWWLKVNWITLSAATAGKTEFKSVPPGHWEYILNKGCVSCQLWMAPVTPLSPSSLPPGVSQGAGGAHGRQRAEEATAGALQQARCRRLQLLPEGAEPRRPGRPHGLSVLLASPQPPHRYLRVFVRLDATVSLHGRRKKSSNV